MSEETYFSKMKYRFQPIPDDARIETIAFLDACGEIIPFLHILGSSVQKAVKSDIKGNIKKLRKIFWEDPEMYKTLQGMVEDDIEMGTTKYYKSATNSLLWLKRTLTFIRVFLEQVLSEEPDLSKCATAAYERSLKKYNGWLSRHFFRISVNMAMDKLPSRKDFIVALGKDSSEEVILEHMQQALDELAPNLDVLIAFYHEKGEDGNGRKVF